MGNPANTESLQEVGGNVARIQALAYRSLKYLDQRIAPFQVLVGPNASGKSTFLDTIAFVGDLLRTNLETAVRGDPRFEIPLRAPDAGHLVWMRGSEKFELALEFTIPRELRVRNPSSSYKVCRYEISVEASVPARITSETLWLKSEDARGKTRQQPLFPSPPSAPSSIVHPHRSKTPKGWKKVVTRSEEPERVTFISETSGWNNPFRLGPDKAALSSLPEDRARFPVATWLRQTLQDGVQRIALSSEAMRRPSAPARAVGFLPDGSNLPWVIHQLEQNDPQLLADWTAHVREALPDLRTISTREREEDRHRYLVLKYESGLEAPSWLASDGTLRLLALTLLAYARELHGVILIEEPENGIHPRAVETVYQSLSSVYGAQILTATHSPVVLSMADPSDVLCFARDEMGATDVVLGSEHPALKDWRGAVDLGELFAGGVLG